MYQVTRWFEAGSGKLASLHWKAAFVVLEALILGQYHDVVPNLLQQLNALRRRNREDLAVKLQKHISKCSKKLLHSTSVLQSILG